MPPDERALRLTLAATVLGSGIAFLDQTVVTVALPALREDLDATLAAQQWVIEAYLLTLGALLLVAGPLAARFGRRRVFALGLAGFAATSLACAVAPTAEVLVGARAVQGAAAGALSRSGPPRRPGRRGGAARAEQPLAHHRGVPAGAPRRRDRVVDRVDGRGLRDRA